MRPPALLHVKRSFPPLQVQFILLTFQHGKWIFFSNGFFFQRSSSSLRPRAFLLEIDLDNLESSMSSCIFFFFSIFFFCPGRDPFCCSHAPLNRAKPGYNYFLWDESSLIWKKLWKSLSRKPPNPKREYFYQWCTLPRGRSLKFQIRVCVNVCTHKCSHISACVYINTYNLQKGDTW